MFTDIVFVNGQVVTVDQQDRIAEAVAVKGNRIVQVGSNQDAKGWITEQTTVIDLCGKSLLPGFIDAHLHLTIQGAYHLGINCKALGIQTMAELFEALKKKAQETPTGQWIRASGFDQNTLAEKRFPTRWELDQISKDHPIVVIRTCNHISVSNSKSLELAGIDEQTPNPEDGYIGRDEAGIPTGLLKESIHYSLLKKADFTEEEMRKAISLASDEFVAAGITSVHDAGSSGTDTFRLMLESVRTNQFKPRLYAMVVNTEHIGNLVNGGLVSGLGDERFRIGPAKVFVDGASSGGTMSTREPHTGKPDEYGILYYTQDQLNQILGEAHQKGFQITAHAQGDKAIDMLLNCFEEVLANHPRSNHRHRIEHAGLSQPDLIKKMKDLQVIPIPNPAFFYEFGDTYELLYGERSNQMFPLREMMDHGIIAAAGSDSPITNHNPLLGIYGAVTRKSKSGKVYGEHQRVSVLEAIRMYTWNGAFASFEEGQKGSIEVGKLADLVVLHDRILDAEPAQIKEMQVELTLIDGEIVYSSAGLESAIK